MDKSYEWIKSAISTSISQFHLDCCERLIEFFQERYLTNDDRLKFEEYYNLLLQDLINKKIFLQVEV